MGINKLLLSTGFHIRRTICFLVVIYLTHINDITLMGKYATTSLRYTAKVGINNLICLTEDSLAGVELLENCKASRSMGTS